MVPITRLLLAGGLCLVAPLGTAGDEKKAAPRSSAPLVTSELDAEKAAVRGAEVVRAVAASEPTITDRHGAHMSTRMGDIRGGGMIMTASCKQKFSVTGVLAGARRGGEREVAYSILERAVGFPLPGPTRPVAKGEKVVLVLGADGSLIKVIPDTDGNRKEIDAVTRYVLDRPPAAQALLGAMRSFTLKLEYHGPQPDVYPSVWCTTNPRLPERLPRSGWWSRTCPTSGPIRRWTTS